MKKNFLPTYEPPRLVCGNNRWYILFYAPDNRGHRTRYRPTFNLNRINDVDLRRERGHELVAKMNWWLVNGQDAWRFDERLVPPLDQQEINPLPETNIMEAFEVARNVKANSDRKDTNKCYNSIFNLFTRFLKKKKWHRMPIKQFSRRHAIAYMDHCIVDRKVGPCTYNNNIIVLRALLYALIEREYYPSENPFAKIKMKKLPKKQRRNFTQQEARTVIQYIQKSEPLLFIALLLEYCCFARPAEIRHLKFRDIHLEKGLVFIDSRSGKTREDRSLTIPNEFIKYFSSEFFSSYPSSYYIFGSGFQPHPTKQCGNNTMGKKHRDILRKLKENGSLTDITGLQWYSWKDTGITDALDDIPLLAVQDQAGHSTPEMTLRYRHKKLINKKIKEGFKNRVI